MWIEHRISNPRVAGSSPAGRELFVWFVMVSVAQMVERRIVIPVVVGSSPIVHPIFLFLLNPAYLAQPHILSHKTIKSNTITEYSVVLCSVF